MENKKTYLFEPIKIKDVTIKNRIAVSPMCMYSGDNGFSNHWHLVHIGSRAVGGSGLIIMESTAVSPEGRISPGDLGLWKPEHITGLRDIVDFGTAQGAVMGIQLGHAGRKASTSSPWTGGKYLSPEEDGWQTIAPSPIPFHPSNPAPREMNLEDIGKVVMDFQRAARRALEAGFEAVEIHAAHGYLLHQFLSPLSNKRTDEYGGSFENRTRFVLEVTEAVRAVWPENLPLLVRISATDWADGGWNPDESVRLAKILKSKGVDLIDCSTGGLIPNAKIPVEKGYQIPFAERIRKETGILTGAVGLITEPEEAEAIIAQGKADMAFIAREFLRDPYFPLHAAEKLGAKINWPNQYKRAKPHSG